MHITTKCRTSTQSRLPVRTNRIDAIASLFFDLSD